MLKTTKEFDFVYKNSYKFRSESLDICVLRANMAGQFFAKFRRLPCNLIGFSVSKKVGIAVERNLIKRRLRAICREFFSPINSSLGEGNSPLGLHSADLANRHKARTQSPLSLCQFTKNHESQTENPSVVDSALCAESSKKINCEESKKFVDSSRCRAHNDESFDCHEFANANSRNDERGARFANSRNDDMVQNLVCIFIAKGQILQIPFATLKNNIFATLKKQLNFRQNRPAQNRPHKITQKGML